MDHEKIIEILRRFKNGGISEADTAAFMENLPFEDVGFAKIDHHREMRWGFPEVIFGRGKTPSQVRIIAQKIAGTGSNLLATHATEEMYLAVQEVLPEARYNEAGKTITCLRKEVKKLPGRVPIVTAGTSDMPVAAEALETGLTLGLDAWMIQDVGVAGIHRVMNHRGDLDAASVIIVIAGMEGALASVIAGMVSSPVIAVPTSVGYGASFSGLTPLLGMLNSCVPGVAVMNIDNGFGAAFLAFKILNTISRMKEQL